MPYNFDCDLCKKNQAIEEYGGRLILWNFKSFESLYAAKLCNRCEDLLIAILRTTVINPELSKAALDRWGLHV